MPGFHCLMSFYNEYNSYVNVFAVVKVRGNAIPWPLEIAGERSQTIHS